MRNFTKVTFPYFPNQPEVCPMNNVLLNNPLKKGSISRIYNYLSQIDSTTTLDHIKDA